MKRKCDNDKSINDDDASDSKKLKDDLEYLSTVDWLSDY